MEAAEDLHGRNILSNFSICYTLPTLNLVNMHRNLIYSCIFSPGEAFPDILYIYRYPRHTHNTIELLCIGVS